MIAAAWAWGILGVVVFLGIGLLAALMLGLLGAPFEVFRRVEGEPEPSEVPELTAEETAAEVDERADG
jgi:hypothetical protein